VEEAAQRFARFTGRNAVPSSLGQTVALDRGSVELVSADSFAGMLPEIPIPSLPFSGAYGIRVKSLTALDDMLRRAGLPTWRRGHDLATAFPEEIGRGAWLFSE
jgi:hypothetical protein